MLGGLFFYLFRDWTRQNITVKSQWLCVTDFFMNKTKVARLLWYTIN